MGSGYGNKAAPNHHNAGASSGPGSHYDRRKAKARLARTPGVGLRWPPRPPGYWGRGRLPGELTGVNQHEMACITWESLHRVPNHMICRKEKRKLSLSPLTRTIARHQRSCHHRPPKLAENQLLRAKHSPPFLVRQEKG